MARGLKVAIDYLNSFHPIKLVPEELKKRAGLDCMSDTLARKLRDNTNRLDPLKGRVIVSYEPAKSGKNEVAYYQGNPSFVAPERKPKREDTIGCNPKYAPAAPAVFFYAIEGKGSLSFSPYYINREDMEKKMVEVKAACGTEQFKFPTYTGSHENPVRLA